MKKIIVVVCVLLILVLLVPFPAKIKDGGSIHYDAILYDVYDVHKIYDSGPDTEMKYVEGVIIMILGIQIYNNTNPHIESISDHPNSEN